MQRPLRDQGFALSASALKSSCSNIPYSSYGARVKRDSLEALRTRLVVSGAPREAPALGGWEPPGTATTGSANGESEAIQGHLQTF